MYYLCIRLQINTSVLFCSVQIKSKKGARGMPLPSGFLVLKLNISKMAAMKTFKGGPVLCSCSKNLTPPK